LVVGELVQLHVELLQLVTEARESELGSRSAGLVRQCVEEISRDVPLEVSAARDRLELEARAEADELVAHERASNPAGVRRIRRVFDAAERASMTAPAVDFGGRVKWRDGVHGARPAS
jgi:hypothetical protein